MIKGLTDKFVIRRVGKIRSGWKDEGERGRLHNPKNFLLHDAKQLIPILGEEPSEIYLTVASDDLNAVAPNDLRWYTKSELMCLGDGEEAAYFASNEVAGLTQANHAFGKSRVRRCAYRNCQEYQAGLCGEHIFLNFSVPQYSMAASFTLDSTSFNAVMNVIGALQSTLVYGGPQGQIFRLYKKDMELNYIDAKSGKKSKAPRPVVHMDFVPFEQYEKMFRDKIAPHDWAALMALRSRQIRFVTDNIDFQKELPESVSKIALPQPEGLSDEELIKQRANHPEVMKLFEELAAIRKKPLTESAVFNTAKMVPNTEALIDWLKKTVAMDKQKLAKAEVKVALPEVVPEVVTQPVQVVAEQPPGLF